MDAVETLPDAGGETEQNVAPVEWHVPKVVQDEYLKHDAELRATFVKLGSLEADYQATKARLLKEVESRHAARIDTILKAAKAAGLDVDNNSWNLDTRRMVLVKSKS
jgi:hypothetical protein